jgi:hypothetical protein
MRKHLTMRRHLIDTAADLLSMRHEDAASEAVQA